MASVGLAILFFILTLVFITYFAQGWISWHDYKDGKASKTKQNFSQVMTWMALAFALLSLMMAGFFALSGGDDVQRNTHQGAHINLPA